MAALPDSTTATAVDAEEGDVKNFLTGVRAFLSGLFGTTGTAADARAALGVTPLTSGSIATALGYTPANASHAHPGAYAPMTAFVDLTGPVADPVDATFSFYTLVRADGSSKTFRVYTPATGGGGE